jgi:hypothetical protein
VKYMSKEDARYVLVECCCGMVLKVLATQYRVECPCGKSSILYDLKREALNASEKTGKSIPD